MFIYPFAFYIFRPNKSYSTLRKIKIEIIHCDFMLENICLYLFVFFAGSFEFLYTTFENMCANVKISLIQALSTAK